MHLFASSQPPSIPKMALLSRSVAAPPCGLPEIALPKLHYFHRIEMAAGRLAAQRATDADVRSLARVILRDHESLDGSVRAAARSRGLSLGEVCSRGGYEYGQLLKLEKDLNALQAIYTPAFDTAYLKATVAGLHFFHHLVDEILADPTAEPIRKLLVATKRSTPLHYGACVRILNHHVH